MVDKKENPGTHICLHEGELAAMIERSLEQGKKLNRLCDTTDKIFNRLEGKGGIAEELTVLKTKLKLIPSYRTLIFYSSIGGALALIGFVFLKFMFDKLTQGNL